MARTWQPSRERSVARVRQLERRIRSFQALPEEERRVLAVVALFPCSVWRHVVLQMCALMSQRTSTRAIENSRLNQYAQKWKELDLVGLTGVEIQCDVDLGTYLVRRLAETTFGDPIRQSVKANVAWWVSLASAADTCAYEVRLLRLSGKKREASDSAKQFLQTRRQSGRTAVLFGPGDPWFVPSHVSEWATLLPAALELDVRALHDLAWEIELFEAATNEPSDQVELGALLLPTDGEARASLRELLSCGQLERSSAYRSLWYTWQLFQGHEPLIREAAEGHMAAGFADVEAFLAVLDVSRDSLESSLERFARACASPKKNALSAVQTSWLGVVRILALLATEVPEHCQLARDLTQSLVGKRACRSDEPAAVLRLAEYSAWQTGVSPLFGKTAPSVPETALSVLVALIVLCWQEPAAASHSEFVAAGQRLREIAQSLSHEWLVAQLDAVLRRLAADPSTPIAQHSKLLVDLVVPKPDWEMTLDALSRVADSVLPPPPTQTTADEPTTRIAWLVRLNRHQLHAEPRLQTKKGSAFSRGKPIALERLIAPIDDTLPMTPADLAIAAHITRGYSYRGQTECALEPGFCLALVGHPYVFDLQNESLHYEVRRGHVQLRCVRSNDGSHRLALQPPIDATLEEAQFVAISDSELIVYELTNNLRRLSKLISNELLLPAEAGPQLQQLLPRLSALLPTSANLDLEQSVEVTPGDTLPVLRIRPRAEALRVQCLVTPLGLHGNAYRPGEGDVYLADLRDGKSQHVQRDLPVERARAQALFERVPSLRGLADDFEATAHGLVECLTLVSELAELTPGEARVEWPEGEPLKLRRLQSIRVAIGGGDAGRWFEAEGSVYLGDDTELRIVELLDRLGRAEGRFVRLSKDDYLELNQSTLEQLRLLEAFRIGDLDDGTLRLAPWIALALPEDSLEQFEALGSRSWLTWRQRVTSLYQQKPRLPEGFVGTLRDYQLAGFEWLVRMAALRAGVCLADDMGLGKTVQALALLLHRATRRLNDDEPARPLLIVAPASVCPGWISEAGRFTPELELRWLTGSARNLDGLTRRTLVVCTYEILYRDREALSSVDWDTVVLDEAHHIKNAQTHRARAAFSLRADFRLATTGTPVENHLGELFSLYRFLMPGLLGEPHQFVERYRSPIENERSSAVRKQLQALIRPFLLRRTKQQVLSELPARTEMLRQIELSRAELELYEAVRQRGLLALSEAGADRNQQRVRVLAELMRLRRACCHPKLVLRDSEIASSKLAALLDLVEELREGGHRALVFSQFVDHLSLVREALDDQGIRYQYLDGSTPIGDRARRVDAFQSGSGDLFLISLRAGGTGLNLTAADYVIHLDPWWNPAVEDQASDRAHRIGQVRPVTIYRLVARGTIEERLVAMHAEKRSLAADILEGAEQGARLDPDELFELLREASVAATKGATTGEYAIDSHPE